MESGFQNRHIGLTDDDIQSMLSTLGLKSLDALIDETIPANLPRAPKLTAEPLSETALLASASKLGKENLRLTSMIGCGYSNTYMPAVIRRNVMENPDWYTAYTPYQPEISQGRLEMLMVFQQMVMDLTGLEIANASLLDEATAAAEAMMMAKRLSKNTGDIFYVDENCHPQTIAVLKTRAEPVGIKLVVGEADITEFDDQVFGAIFQYPASTGQIRDFRGHIEALHAQKAIVTLAADPLALAMLTPPGELGADIAIGSTQRFGIPMGYGGPHAAYFATRDAFKRSVPGRLIGLSVDGQGRPAYRMALQTREQHIRREKATSNICTSQVLLAVLAAMYAIYHGQDGITRIATDTHRHTVSLANRLSKAGFTLVNTRYFDTLLINAVGKAAQWVHTSLEAGFNLRLVDADHFSISLDETTSEEQVNQICCALGAESADTQNPAVMIPPALERQSDFLTHTVFSAYRSETALMRYLRNLARKDITLARAMIPLGSCTMKLNAATEMEPLSNPDFAELHPFVPAAQAAGYQKLIKELSESLCEITGYDAFSMQPNAGSQGEFAGLLCIRNYHLSRNDARRNVCLIPSSAHGTNPASAVMAGMKVVIINCLDDGSIDFADLTDKAEQYSEQLAALMVTYPSTYGVFETRIQEICALIHQHGGQIYLDGANLNAMVGLCRPGDLGADVSHLNLHKTFAIPHGGGGPGMGPIGVKKHLAPFLPGHPMVEGVNPLQHTPGDPGTVSAAPWGSPLILPISWAYIKLLGGKGLSRATQAAILSSNYIANRLAEHYPIRYTGENGRVAHECIIDLSEFRASANITVEDVAKRLMDYGFHSPTMSWPVPDSLMIEPTESEPLSEIDRFIHAMIAIRKEISRIESGAWSKDDNPLVNAPHSEQLIDEEDWTHPYSRQLAFFPNPEQKFDKYWPPVGRIDNIYGDRNVQCACPAPSEYA